MPTEAAAPRGPRQLRGLMRLADGRATACAGLAKARLLKELVQYMLSDAVQGNASAWMYGPMSPDTVRALETLHLRAGVWALRVCAS